MGLSEMRCKLQKKREARKSLAGDAAIAKEIPLDDKEELRDQGALKKAKKSGATPHAAHASRKFTKREGEKSIPISTATASEEPKSMAQASVDTKMTAAEKKLGHALTAQREEHGSPKEAPKQSANLKGR